MRDTDDTVIAGGNVMLMCEDGGIGLALERILGRNGRHLTRGGCTPDAVDQVRSCHPDMVLIETRARDTAGFGLCQAIRGDPDLDDIKLLMVQDSGRAIDRRRAKALGVDGFLSMPFANGALQREVNRLLDRW